MQYRKHNLSQNLPAALAAKDYQEAWEIVANEINDITLELADNQQVKDAILCQYGLPATASERDISLAMFDQLSSPEGRAKFMKNAMAHRDTPFTGAMLGPFDSPGNPAAALDELVGLKDPAITTDKARKMVAQDLLNKQTMRNLPVRMADRLATAGPLKITLTVLALGAAVWVGVRLYQGKSIIPFKSK